MRRGRRKGSVGRKSGGGGWKRECGGKDTEMIGERWLIEC